MERRLNLALLILLDLKRHWFQVILSLAILGSALTTIVVTDDTRSVTAELNKVQSKSDDLEVEWRHLVLEQNAQAEHSRVSDIAKVKLAMTRPKPLEEKMISLP
ncbi:MAG: cell division protein FtsL [Tolumonas sp.]|jgi:cell division protein FtsL|uniref:cell division protein FtsL n=1 Tax=uncultured Tolumonas sp. TaxID=263765 RepID=UPI002A0A73F6|nr:cell division protein FtsL [uncultured Tolumonas sp.]MDD2342112.1 cell division protein FtsL [Tolumonas sp.]MDD2840854.1 cell division protein FtsL [Tolumonas sp.]